MSRPPTEPDRPARRHEATAFVIVGLMGLALMTVGVGALVLPPGVSFALVRRGLGEGHLSWVALGAIIGVVWLVLLTATARKLLHRGAAAE